MKRYLLVILVFTLFSWNAEINTDKNIDKGLSDIASMSEEEITDYIIEYSNGKYKNYKSVLWINMLEEVQRYFPHIKFGEWMWEVVGKADNKYLIEINSIDPNTREKNNSLIAQMILEPDGTLKILENTVCTQPQNGLCVYASDIQYLYHGCAIREYNVEFYNEEKDIYLKAVIPLFSLENSSKWNEINRSIWEGLETWLNEQTNLQSGNILLNYEISNLDNNLFSIFMQGSYETEGAESRQIALGMTVSLDSEELVSGKFLGVDTKQDSYFDFYVEDDRLYFINASQSIDLQYYTFEIDRNQRNVYTSDGRWVGECYYELPQIKPGVGELAIINDKLKEDMGRFFCGAARDFEVSVLEIMEGNDEDMTEIYGGPGYRCNVESKVTLNGDGKLGITYLYTINLGAIQEKGEAGVIYEIETGKTLEYEDWQGTLNLGK